MTIQDLIQELQNLIEFSGVSPDAPVKLAQQPSWPFEYSIGQIVAVDINEPDEDEEREVDESEFVVYIGESTQDGYLHGAARSALGWR